MEAGDARAARDSPGRPRRDRDGGRSHRDAGGPWARQGRRACRATGRPIRGVEGGQLMATYVRPAAAKPCTACGLRTARRVKGEPILCGICALDARVAEYAATKEGKAA